MSCVAELEYIEASTTYPHYMRLSPANLHQFQHAISGRDEIRSTLTSKKRTCMIATYTIAYILGIQDL